MSTPHLINIFKKISDRVWVPHQAALEYQENRLSVIAEQVRRYDEVETVLRSTRNKLGAELGNLQLKKRHSSIDPDDLLEKVDNVFDQFIKNLEAHKKEQPDVFDEDKLRDAFDSFLKGKIGPPPTQEYLEKIYEEGRARFQQKRPPGYMDQEKAKGEKEFYLFGDLVIKREYGDLILWFQLLQEAKDREVKLIIFITDDEKED